MSKENIQSMKAMHISGLILLLLAAALLISCGKGERVAQYAQKLPAPTAADEDNPISRYNKALTFNKPICLVVNVKGAT